MDVLRRKYTEEFKIILENIHDTMWSYLGAEELKKPIFVEQ